MGVSEFFLGWLGASLAIIAVGALLYFTYRRVSRLIRRRRSRLARRRHHRAHHHAAPDAAGANAGDLTTEGHGK